MEATTETTTTETTNNVDVTGTVTEGATQETVLIERRVYLRGRRGTPKRILVLHRGVLYTPEFQVAGFNDLGGETCQMRLDTALGIFIATWGDGSESKLAPAS